MPWYSSLDDVKAAWGSFGWTDSGWTQCSTNTSNNYYQFSGQVRIARGDEDLIMVAVRIQIYGKDYEQSKIRTIPLKGRVQIGSAVSTSGEVTCIGSYGAMTTYATRYYVGRANNGTSVYARVVWTDSQTTGWVTKTAGPYRTTYTMGYSSNAPAWAYASNTKTYNEPYYFWNASGWGKTGHTFSRWNTDPNGWGTDYWPGGEYTTNAALTLYAIWTPIPYTLSYNGNGPNGAAVSNLPGSQTKDYGTSYTVSSTVPTCTGYVFSHWNTAANGSGTTYRAGNTITVTGNITLYAIWLNTYAITYNGNGATGGSTTGQTKTHGSSVTIKSNGFTRDKHTFLYWNTKANGTGTRYDPGYVYTTNAALTLYAIWLKNNIPVFYKDSNGVVHQVEKAFYKDNNGNVHECTMYYRDNNGVIHIIS